MPDNQKLITAKKQKKDEFYTQLSDIERELRHYKQHFADKVVLCNCDDPKISNFYKYFMLNFHVLKLKKLICTCYKNQDIDLFTQNKAEQAVYITLERNVDQTSYTQTVSYLQQDGDFRSTECVELLKQADIVVTNPPFSLFRKYIELLFKYEKKFVIIGHQNAITYKEIFPLILQNKLWLGYGFPGNVGYFMSNYDDYAKSTNHKEGMIRVSGVTWFTNLDIPKRHEELPLYKKYSPGEYPQYDNYDAINVDKVKEIPCDYTGVIGVPITFLEKYCPEQFLLIGATESEGKGFSNGLWHPTSGIAQSVVSGKRTYKRLFIQHKI